MSNSGDDEYLNLDDLFGQSPDLGTVEFKDKSKLGLSCDVLFQDDLQERVQKYLNKKMKKDSKVDVNKIFKENNIQKTSNVEQIKRKILISEINQGLIGGFSNADSNIEYLKELNFEKNFIVESPDQVVKYNEFFNTKSILLRVFHADNINISKQKKENLFSFIDKMIDDEKIEEKVQIGLDCGFKFALTMIKELKSLNQQSLINSLQFIHSTLKMSSQGSLYGVDKFSFMIDQNMNEARSFTIAIIEEYTSKIKDPKDENYSQNLQVIELSFKILILMGMVRCNVEDLLLVTSLLDKYQIQVDLREEIKAFSNDDIKFREKIIGVLKKGFSDKKILNSVPLFYFKSGIYKADAIKLDFTIGLTCDSSFIYLHQKSRGLLKIGSGQKGTSYGQVYLHNKNFRKDEQIDLLFHNNMLYCRSEAIQDKPFVYINTMTLEEQDYQMISSLEDKNEEQHSLSWMDSKNKQFKGRILQKTPMFSDGIYIYIIAQRIKHASQVNDTRKYPSDNTPLNIVECYEVKENGNFILVKEAVLIRNKEQDPFIELDVSHSFATNGQLLYYQSTLVAYVFDIDSGLLMEESPLVNEFKHSKFAYSNSDNIFYKFFMQGKKQRLEMFKILNFKKQQQSKQFTYYLNDLKVNILKEISGKYIDDKDSKTQHNKPQSLIQKLVKKETIRKEENQIRENKCDKIKLEQAEQFRTMFRTFILSQIVKYCNDCNNKIEENRFFEYSIKDSQKNMIHLFKFPNATYLSSLLFELLQDSVYKFLYLKDIKKMEHTIMDQYSLYFILSIMLTNFEAMIQCNITLPEILDKELYVRFIDMYKTQFIQFITATSPSEIELENCPKKSEMQCLWTEIHNICQKINAISLNFFYQSNTEIIERIEYVIKTIENNPQEIASVCVLMNHITQQENSINIFKQDVQCIKMVSTIYEECCKIKSKSVINLIKQCQIEGNMINYEEDQHSSLVVQSGKFIKVINEQINFYFQNLIEEQKSDDDSKQKIKIYQNMILKFFETACTELSCYINQITNLICGQLLSLDKERFKEIEEKYYRFSSLISSIFVNQSAFYYIVSLHIQQFSLENNQKSIPKIVSALKEIMHDVNYYYSSMSKLDEKFEFDLKKDSFRNNIHQFTRRICFYIGLQSYKLIKIQKPLKQVATEDEQQQPKDEQIEDLIIQSSLLSGGINNIFLPHFSDKSVQEIKELNKLALENKLNQVFLEGQNDNVYFDREYHILEGIVNQGQNEFIDKLINYLQKLLEKKIPSFKVGGEQGFRLARAAFSLMIKFSELFDEFSQIIDMIELRSEEFEEKDSNLIMADILNDYKGFAQIQKRWEKAAQMRKWLNEKKGTLSTKISKRASQQLYDNINSGKIESEKKEEQKNSNIIDNEIIQIDTSSKAQEDLIVNTDRVDEQITESKKALTLDQEATLNEMVEVECNQKINVIVNNIIEKAQFLNKLNVSQSLLAKESKINLKKQMSKQKKQDSINPNNQDSQRKQYNAFKLDETQQQKQRDSDNAIENVLQSSNLTWNDKSKQICKDILSLEGSIQNLKDKKEQIFESSINSILAVLQLRITTTKLKQSVENAFLKGIKRRTGLKLLSDIISLELPYIHKQDLMNWFCSSLRDNTNKVTHYLDDLQGCGEYLENQCKQYFFQIIGTLIRLLKQQNEEWKIIEILKCLHWKFTARDHGHLFGLQLLKYIHEGSPDIKKDNKIMQCWGKPVKGIIYPNKLTAEILKYFENIFTITLSRIIKPDLGTEIKVEMRSQHQAAMPLLVSAQSMVDENMSEKLIHEAVDIIFQEFERYNKIINMAQGMDWGQYQKVQNKEFNYQKISLLDQEEDEKNKEECVIPKLYSQSFLRRLIRLLDLFTSAATKLAQPLAMINKVSQGSHLIILINLFLTSPPRIKISVLKIFQNLIKVDLPFLQFEDAIRQLQKDSNSQMQNILSNNIGNTQENEDCSLFVKFLYQYLLQIRSKMYDNSTCESEGQYVIAQEIICTLQFIMNSAPQDYLQTSVKNKVLNFLSQPFKIWNEIEQSVILSLLPFGNLFALQTGVISAFRGSQNVIILGFSDLLKEGQILSDLTDDNLKKFKSSYYCTHPLKQKALTLLQGDKNMQFIQEVRCFDVNKLNISIVSQYETQHSQVILKNEKVLSNLIEILSINLNNNNTLTIGPIQSQIIKIILNNIENDKINKDQHTNQSLIKIMSDYNLLIPFFISLQNIIQNQTINCEGIQLPKYLLEMNISMLQSKSIETNLALHTKNIFPLKAILYNCNTLTISETKPESQNFYVKHCLILTSINERNIHSILSYKNLSIEFYSEIRDKYKFKHISNIIIIENQDLNQNQSENLCKAYQQCQAIVCSNSITTQEFCNQLFSIIGENKNINKNGKPVFIISKVDMQELKDRSMNYKQNSTVYTTVTKQFDDLLNNDLQEFGGFKDQDINDFKLLQKDQSKQSPLLFLTQFKAECQSKTQNSIKNDFKGFDEFLEQQNIIGQENSNDIIKQEAKQQQIGEQLWNEGINKINVEELINVKMAAFVDQNVSQVEVNQFYNQVLQLKQNIHEKEFQKQYISSITKYIKISSIDLIMILIFTNDYIYTEIFSKQLDQMNKLLIQIYNEAIYLKNAVGDTSMINKFKNLLKNISKEDKNQQMIQNIISNIIIHSIPKLVKKIVSDPSCFKNEVFNVSGDDQYLPNPYFILSLISIFMKQQPVLIFGSGQSNDIKGNCMISNIISSLLSLILSCTYKNPNSSQFPKKAMYLLLKIFATLSQTPKNYIHQIQEFLKNNTLIDKIRQQFPKFKNTKKSEIIKLWQEIFYYLTKIQQFQIEYSQQQMQQSIVMSSLSTTNGLKTSFIAKIKGIPESDSLTFKMVQFPTVFSQYDKFQLFMDSDGINKQYDINKDFKDKEFFMKKELYLGYVCAPNTSSLYSFGDMKCSKYPTQQLGQNSLNVLGVNSILNNAYIISIQPSKHFTTIMTNEKDLMLCGSLKGTNKSEIFSSNSFIKLQGAQKIKQYSVGRNNIVIVKDDKTILFMGKSKQNHFDQSSKIENTDFYKQNTEEIIGLFKSDVQEICSGNNFTVFLTTNGCVYLFGNFNGLLNIKDDPQDQKSPEKIKTQEEEINQISEIKSNKLIIQINPYIKKICLSEEITMKAERVWCSKAKNAYAFIIEVNQAGKKCLMSFGQHSKGLLGQGEGITQSLEFKPLDYDSSTIIFEKISLYGDHAIGITTTKEIYGWGSNENLQLGIPEGQNLNFFKPTKIQFFSDQDKFQVNHITCGLDFTLIGVKEFEQNWQNSEYKLFYVGLEPKSKKGISLFGANGLTHVKQGLSIINKFNNVNVKLMIAGINSSFIYVDNLQNKIQDIDKDVKTFYEQNIKNEVEPNKFVKGVLHFYPESVLKENVQDNEEVKQIDTHSSKLSNWIYKTGLNIETDNEKLPDICLALKHSIPDFSAYQNYFQEIIMQAKECLDYSYKEEIDFGLYCDDSKSRIKNVMYCCKYQEQEGCTKEINLCSQSFNNGPTEFDVQPLIYFRLGRPLKEGAVLPCIDIDKIFYGYGEDFQFSFTTNSIFQNYNNKEILRALILYNDAKNAQLKEIYLQSISQKLNKDPFWKKVEDFLNNYPEQDKIKSLDDILVNKEKDIKDFLENSKSLKLDEQTRKIVGQMTFLDCNNYNQITAIVYILSKYYNYGMKIFEKLSTRIVKDQIYDYIPIKRRQFIQQLPGLYKNEFVKKMVDQLPKGEQKAITIRRRKALMFKEKGQIDHEGTKSMFGQMIQQIKSDFDAKVKCFCVNKADASIFKITFKGEGGSDHGGLYRDFITCVCNEIQSKVLPLLIQTPNNKSEHGENRDSFIINPASNKPTHLEMFKFFGYFLGMAIRSEQYLPLDLAPIFWKSLLDEHIVQSDQEKENDYRDMDLYSYQTLQYLKNKADQLSDQEFETEAHMKFVTHLSDGQEVEVCQDGWSKIVTKANVDEYIRLAIETRINESKQQVKAIIEGINFVMPKNIYCFFNWKQLELRATGAKLIDLDQLKAITKYDGCSKTDLYVQFFWQTLEGFTNYERSLYLKFVWGRTRLLSSGDTEHKVVSATYNEKSCLPKSATCFFKIYLPKYPTFEKCRNSMLTAISYCGDIDNDRVVSGNDSADED